MKKLLLLPIVAAFAFAVLGVGSAGAVIDPVPGWLQSTCDYQGTTYLIDDAWEGDENDCPGEVQTGLNDGAAGNFLVCIDGVTYHWAEDDEGGDWRGFASDVNNVPGHSAKQGACASAPVPPPPPRAGYCTAAGNTDDYTGAPIPAGTFVNLILGQPSSDSNYTGATPAFYVDGTGLTCDPPSGVFSLAVGELVDGNGQPNPDGIMLPGNIYPHYVQG